MRVRLVVFGDPIPMPRPRVTHGGQHTFNPTEATRAKQAIANAARFVRVPFFVGPVRLTVDVYLSTEGITFWKRGSGDADNYFKLVADALEDVAYANDAQVVDGRCRKHPAADGRPRLEVLIEGEPGARPQPRPKRVGRAKLVPVPAVYRRTR